MITEEDIPPQFYMRYCNFVGGPADGKRFEVDVRRDTASIADNSKPCPPLNEGFEHHLTVRIYFYRRHHYRRGLDDFWEYHYHEEDNQ